MAEGQTAFKLDISDFMTDGNQLVLSNQKAIEYWQAYSSYMTG